MRFETANDVQFEQQTTLSMPSAANVEEMMSTTLGSIFRVVPGHPVFQSYAVQYEPDGTVTFHPIGDPS